MGRMITLLLLGLSLLLTPAASLAGHHESGEGKGPQAEKAKGAEKSADKAKGDAMRERSGERKEMMDSYKDDVKAGGERVKGKKPWWKFWGSDDAE